MFACAAIRFNKFLTLVPPYYLHNKNKFSRSDATRLPHVKVGFTLKPDLLSSQLYSLSRTAMFPTGAFSFFNAGWRRMLPPPPPPSHRRNPPSPQGQRFPLPFCVQPKDASTPPTLKMMNDVWETMPEDKEQVEETLTGSCLHLPH